MKARSTLPAIVILTLAILSLSINNTRNPTVHLVNAATENLKLNGDFSGWNFTTPPSNPPITVIAGDTLSISLKSVDSFSHRFFVDVDHSGTAANCQPTGPDRCSLSFGSSAITYTFPIDFWPNTVPGGNNTYTYYCVFHPFTMLGKFTVLAHNAAATGLAVSRGFAYVGIMANPIKVDVTVVNGGNFTESSITVTATANSTVTIGTQTVTSLSPGSSKIVTLSWDTTSLARGVYTLSAQVSLAGDANSTDDSFTLASLFNARKAGDVNGDGTVNLNDLIAVWQHEFTPGVGSVYDINNDGTIDLSDLIITWMHEFT